MKRQFIPIFFFFTTAASRGLADACPFTEQGYNFNTTCLVKATDEASWYCTVTDEHGHEEKEDYTEFRQTLKGFQAAPPVIIADTSPPPTHTSNPYDTLPLKRDGQYMVSPYKFTTHSLLDLGSYHYEATGFCTDGVRVTAADPGEDYWIIFNHPPTADMAITSGTPYVHNTIVITSNAKDADGGSIQATWSVAERPAGSTSTLDSSALTSARITFLSKSDIGNWKIHLDLVDSQGELKPFDFTFTVENRPPAFTITGDTEIDALTPISLHAGPATDEDGETVTFQWDIVAAPPHADPQPTNNFADTADLKIDTGADEIGTWKFSCTGKDEHGATTTHPATVTVKAVPPEINVDAPNRIEVGQTLTLQDTIENDAYGVPLHFKWALVQVPVSANVPLTDDYNDSDQIVLPTTEADAGTWIFKLTVTDSAHQSVDTYVQVLIDAPPIPEISGPDQINNTSALVLDGSGSVDPDSPDDPPDNGHLSSEGTPKVSPGITKYAWSVLSVPPELEDIYFQGPTEDVLQIAGNNAKLTIPAHKLPAGHWQFRLDVTDDEGNDVPTQTDVTVIDVGADPIASVTAFQAATVNLNGYLATPIILDGSRSFDPDNLNNLPPGSLPTPGLGITEFHWSPLLTPPGCPPPALPSGPTVVYYPAGSVIPAACQGLHAVQLTVTDDDAPAHTGAAPTFIQIGNCPTNLCIDYPTTDAFQSVAFSSSTDVVIDYHLNSAAIVGGKFLAGSRLRLEIYQAADAATPFYEESWDLDPLPTDKGGQLKLHWDGFSDAFVRAPSGWYSIVLKLLDQNDVETGSQAAEPKSIRIETLDIAVATTTPHYVNHVPLKSGAAPIAIDYTYTDMNLPGPQFDQLRFTVYQSSSLAPIFTETVAGALSGHFTWDGHLTSGNLISTGTYTFRLEALRAGVSLGVTSDYFLTVYQLSVEPNGGHAAKKAPGTYVFVNDDDDNTDGISDLLEKAAGEDDLLGVTAQISPAIAGQFVLTSTTPILNFWSDSAKTTAYASPATVPAPSSGTLAFAVEGLSGGQTSLRAGFVTADGVALAPDDFFITTVDVKIMEDTNKDFQISAVDHQLFSVRPGLWDFAFNADSSVPSSFNTLYNENDATALAAHGNPNNFVGRDSRRFYFQVTDPGSDVDPTKVDQVTLDWYTLASTTPVVNADKPSHPEVHLVETGVHTGVFVSAAQMLVTDDVDVQQPTNTGLAHPSGNAAYGAADHRTRRIASLSDMVAFDYSPVSGVTHQWRVPVFSRAPDDRSHLTVQIYNFRDPADPSAPAIDPATIALTTTSFVGRYREAGIEPTVLYNPATDILDSPAGVDLNNVDAFFLSAAGLQASAMQTSLIQTVRARNPSPPDSLIFIIFVGNFTDFDRGESFPDGFSPVAVARNVAFIAGRRPKIDYSFPHEVGHLLTNQTMTPEEYNATAPGWDASGHYGGPLGVNTDMDLMRNGTVAATPESVTDTRRLWDDTDIHHVAQITRMRATRYVKGF